MADGHAYEVDKRGRTWRQWLLGKSPEPATTFGPPQAAKLASDKGYVVSGEPAAKKKHYTVMAAKDGKSYELQVHRDGTIDQQIAFGATDARKLAVDKGYGVTTDPVPMKGHFRVAAMTGRQTI